MHYQTTLERIIAAIDTVLNTRVPELRRIYIANPRAGTRHRHRRTERVATTLPIPPWERDRVVEPPRIAWTGSASEAVAVVRDAAGDGNATVIVSLGGDGTHNHCLQAATGVGSIEILRVPLGSGNDAPEVSTLSEFVDALERPFRRRMIPALEVTREGAPEKPVLSAFNIASLGIDAFVTAMHERWRQILPGNTYRLLVNMAVLRYEKLVDLGECGLSVACGDGTYRDVGATVRTLIAMGVSGHRTYGDHMHVLPGPENLCVLGSASLIDKLRIKKLFYTGDHVREPLSTMYTTDEIVVRYDRRLPIQLDGEAEWLCSSDFPVRFRIRRDAVRVIDPG